MNGRPSWLEPLRHRDYSLLVFGRLLSLVGTQATNVAIAWQVYELTGDPLALGGIGLARILPITVVALAGGVFADAFDRRSLLVATAVAGACTSAVLAWATFAGAVTLPLLYACAAVGGAVTAFDNPARQALLPNLVPREVLGRALSLGTASFHAASVVGPAVGGVLLARAGAEWVYVVDGVSYFAVVGTCLLMRFRSAPANVRPSFAAVLEGIAFLRRTPVLRSTMMLDFFATFLAGATQLFPIFAGDLFDVGPEGLGMLFAAPSIGAGAMAILLAVRSPPKRAGAWILGSVAVYGAAMAGFGLVPWFWVGVGLLALAGAADTISAVLRQVLRQVLTPDELRGRLSSLQMIFFMGGPQLGEMEAGLVASAWNVRGAVWSGGVGAVVLTAYYAWRAPWLRRHRL